MTSTSGTERVYPLVPGRSQRLKAGTVLYVIALDPSREHQKIGDVVTVDLNAEADADDEYSVVGPNGDYGYVERSCVSLTPPPPADMPPSLDPEEVIRWLDQ